jgi:tetratricopeptide (TPR) repeat protein
MSHHRAFVALFGILTGLGIAKGLPAQTASTLLGAVFEADRDRIINLPQESVVTLCNNALKVADSLSQFEEAAIRTRRGWAYVNLHKIPEARADFDWIVKRFPDRSEARHDLAFCMMRQGDVSSAIREWNELIESNPSFIEPYEKLAQTYAVTGKSDRAISTATQGLLQDPYDGTLLYCRAMEYLKADNHDAALSDADRGLSTDSLRLTSPLAGLYFVRGYALIAKKQYVAAESSLNMAIMLDRTKPQYKIAMCRVQWHLNRIHLASALAYSIEKSPEVRADIVMSGVCAIAFFKEHDFVKAAEFVDLVLAKQPADPVMLALSGLIAVGRNDYGTARQQLEKALEHTPDLPEALRGLAVVLAFDPDDQNRDLDRALDCAQRLCEISTEHPATPLAILGCVQLARGDAMGARASFEKSWGSANELEHEKRVAVERYVQLLKGREFPSPPDNNELAADACKLAL